MLHGVLMTPSYFLVVAQGFVADVKAGTDEQDVARMEVYILRSSCGLEGF